MSDHRVAIRAKYDGRADVLYVTLGDGRPDRYVEDGDGLVWRYNADGVVYGVTVMDYHHIWSERRSALVTLISDQLHVAPPLILHALKQ